MRTRFETQLLELNNNLVVMGTLCETAISLSVKAFVEGNMEIAQRAMEIENEIDIKEKALERNCLQLFIQQQPVAKDMRVISSVLKMITDLERIGDQAYDIASLTEYTTGFETPKHINQMAEEAKKMVNQAIDSFVKRDIDLARKVIAHDDVVDDLFNVVKKETAQLIKAASTDEEAEAMMDILMINKYLERIGDHATNVAEWVVYSITGEHE